MTTNGIKPNCEKIKFLKNYPILKDNKALQQRFLGVIDYYRKFINNYAQITKPLTILLRK